jgi:hypothetical protein
VTDYVYRDTGAGAVFRHANAHEGWYDFIRFLTNEHPLGPGLPGPGWAVIEAYDGTNLTVPTESPGSLINLPGNDWNWTVNGTPGTNSWIVLETRDSNNTNHCQVWIRFTSTTVIEIRMIPFQDFVTGGAVTSSPTFPTTSFGRNATVGSHVQWTGTTATARFMGYASEGNFIFFGTDLNTDAWVYVGELDDPADASVGANPPDDRCYVINNQPYNVNPDSVSTDERWTRLSPLDGTTIIGYGDQDSATVSPGIATTQLHPSGIDRSMLNGVDTTFQTGVSFKDTGHVHFAGWHRGLRCGHWALGRMGTLSGRQWLFFSDVVSTGNGAWVMKWDSTTPYP